MEQPPFANDFASQERKAPGSGASTVRVSAWWNSSFRVCIQRGGQFGRFLRSFFRKLATPQDGSTAVMWPMPLPYPKVLVGPGSDEENELASFHRGVNLVIAALNWLHLRRPACCPPELVLGKSLSRLQWKVVRNCERLMAAWKSCDSITAEDMGRTASKIEDIELAIQRLGQFENQAFETLAELENHSGGRSTRPEDGGFRGGVGLRRGSAGDEVGNLSSASMTFAKCIETERLEFRGVPSFDPRKFLDSRSRRLYEHPISSAVSPSEAVQDPPVVRIHANEIEKWKLFKKLDSAGRLGVVLESEVLVGYQSGLFAVPKDGVMDRLIFDSRPFNSLESGSGPWVYSMASASNVLDVQLAFDEELRISSTDLRDYYYAFQIGKERLCRNSLIGPVKPSAIKGYRCYEKRFEKEKLVYLALNSLAMGDTHAVELAQVAHLSLLLQAGILEGPQLLCMHLAVPRLPVMGGVVIDDFVLLEKCLRGCSSGALASEATLRKALEVYEAAGLVPHPKKTFYGQSDGDFWGCSLNGKIGLVQCSLKRVIPVVFVTIGIVKMGIVSVGLLEVVIGCWTSIFLFRRRLLSLLNVCYEAFHRDLPRSTVIRLSEELALELLMCVCLAPLAVTDLRAPNSPFLYSSDASEWGTAVTRTAIPEWLQSEIHRHKLKKGNWSRLLSPSRAVDRLRGVLPLEGELPDGAVLPSHPLWMELSSCLQFEEVERKACKNSVHINILELRGFLSSERAATRCFFPIRFLELCDSQVTLGAVLKGRSSSVGLNQELQQSLAHHLGAGVYCNGGYVPTELNTSDDPTRGKEVRKPLKTKPSWLEEEDTQAALAIFDQWLAGYGSDPYSLSGLPPLNELAPEIPPVLFDIKENSKRILRERKIEKKDRLKRKLEIDLQPEKFEKTSKRGLPKSRLPSAASRGLDCLSPEAVGFLGEVDRRQFLFPSSWGKLPPGWLPDFPGYLDIYSGAKGVAKMVCRLGEAWCICFELEDSPNQDVLLPKNRRVIEGLLKTRAVLCFGAAIFCASFSRAVRPPVRTREEVDGISGLSGKMLFKVQLGNQHSEWLVSLIVICDDVGIQWWVENPDGSFLWLQERWIAIGSLNYKNSLRIDYCRCGMSWRKRTRILTSCYLRGQQLFCLRNHEHRRLVGWSRVHKMSWTRVAQTYPRSLSYLIAVGMLIDSGLLPNRRRVNASDIARSSNCRIGEASNPGPRRAKSRGPRVVAELDNAPLVLPVTDALGTKVWNSFLQWCYSKMSSKAVESFLEVPSIVAELVTAFGRHLYEDGQSLYLLRQLITFLQRERPLIRPFLTGSWQLVSRWEMLEPLCHRTPLPYVVFQAMSVVGLLWGWKFWVGATVLAFEGICRPGEVLRASRRDLLLPKDLVSEDPNVVFLRIKNPKPGKRGIGLVQHSKINTPGVARFLDSIFGDLAPSAPLYCGSPSAYRKRWDTILRALGVPTRFAITPASLRAGGAVKAYRREEDIYKLLWRMRLKSIDTLQHYLQEVGADSTYAELPGNSKRVIQSACPLYPLLIDSV